MRLARCYRGSSARSSALLQVEPRRMFPVSESTVSVLQNEFFRAYSHIHEFYPHCLVPFVIHESFRQHDSCCCDAAINLTEVLHYVRESLSKDRKRSDIGPAGWWSELLKLFVIILRAWGNILIIFNLRCSKLFL